MGYIQHDAVVAVISGYDEETHAAIARFREELPEEFRHLLVGPVVGVNDYRTYLFAPDGSKEGWEHSDEAESWRESFAALARGKRYDDGSGSGNVIHVRFGGDYGHEMGATIVSTTDFVVEPA